MRIKIQLIHPSAHVPERQTEGASGFDLVAVESAVLHPASQNGIVVKVRTGLALEIPPGFEGQVRARSGLSSRGIVLVNGIGTIDSDYRGEVLVPLLNLGDTTCVISVGSRIAQLVFAPVVIPTLELAKSLQDSKRGARGFGSTGGNSWNY